MRLKDIENIIETIATTPNCDFPTALMIINNAPTITTESLVRHGRWVYRQTKNTYFCSECKGDALLNRFREDVLSDWCPHCGAKMDLEEDHE